MTARREREREEKEETSVCCLFRIALCDGAHFFENFLKRVLFAPHDEKLIEVEFQPFQTYRERRQTPDLIVFSHFGEEHDSVRESPTVKTMMISGEAWSLPKIKNRLDVLLDCKTDVTRRPELSSNTQVFYLPFAWTHFGQRLAYKVQDLDLDLDLNLNLNPNLKLKSLQASQELGGEKEGEKEESRVETTREETGDRREAKAKTKFCAFLYSSPVSWRNRFFELLSEYRQVDALGQQPSGKPCPSRAVETGVDNFYDDAVRKYKDYKFVICFENAICPGYVTEKLINALLAGALPIYCGDPHIARFCNPKRFINFSDFESFSACVEHIKKVDSDSNLYSSYFSSPLFLTCHVHVASPTLVSRKEEGERKAEKTAKDPKKEKEKREAFKQTPAPASAFEVFSSYLLPIQQEMQRMMKTKLLRHRRRQLGVLRRAKVREMEGFSSSTSIPPCMLPSASQTFIPKKTELVHVFDHDGPLFDFDGTQRYFSSALAAIRKLGEEKSWMAIASRRAKATKYEESLIQGLKAVGIFELMQLVVVQNTPKSVHLSEIRNHLTQRYGEREWKLVLYDDLEENIKDVEKANFKGVLCTQGLHERHLVVQAT